MPKLTAAEKAQKKLLLEQKREARRIAKEKKDKEKETLDGKPAAVKKDGGAKSAGSRGPNAFALLSADSIHCIFTFLPARDIGMMTFCCKEFCKVLVDGRYPILMSRLHRPDKRIEGAVGRGDLCNDQDEARQIVKQSYGGGNTARLSTKLKTLKTFVNEFVSYLRFVDEAVLGYTTQNYGASTPSLLPPFVNGRFVSVSPEHSICRVGGGGRTGAGGSGVATFGVGRRGQLGHGRRLDEREPRRIIGGIGYGIRIVQVSAGGGLVRVAHTLMLTSTGRVLSHGTGQYGALGHGFSGGKQLPDVLRPQYIDALSGVRCVCVSAGELHSAAVTADGDLYTWGDAFTGQLGHGDKRPRVVPKQVTEGDFMDECIAMVSCGARHTVAVTEEGEVYTFGLGHFGCLGRSFTPFDHDPDAALAGFADELDRFEHHDDANNDTNAQDLMPLEQQDNAAEEAQQEQGRGDGHAHVHAHDQDDVAENTDNEQNGSDINEEPPMNAAQELIAYLDRIAQLSLEDSSDQCIPKIMDSMKSIKIVGACAGHRHTLLLDEHGGMYSCGSGLSGCLGHENENSSIPSMIPMRIKYFDDEGIRISQMSAGVDISMAVSTTGDVYAWGKRDRGRIGLGHESDDAFVPMKVTVESQGEPIRAVDVECGYVHSIIVAINGTIHMCGGVGVFEEQDGAAVGSGRPTEVSDFNIWHRTPEPKDVIKKERWKKYGKYEVKGKRRMMDETFD